MPSIFEGPFDFKLLPHKVEDEESSAMENPTDGVIFFGMCLVMGVACRHLLRRTRVPYTVALLLLGSALGALEFGSKHRLGRVGDGIRLWANIDPDLLLAVFLPPLIFESSLSMEAHQIKKCMVQMLLLAGPGVFISTFCIGAALKLTFPYDWSWKLSLLLGAVLSATDPVAVLAILKELGMSKKLSTIVEGESIMNDGASIVVYQLFYKMVMGQHFKWGAVLKFLTLASVGAVGVGVAFGLASIMWLGFIFDDAMIYLSLTLAVSYIAYFTAQEGADVSGILAVLALGMLFTAVARTYRSHRQRSLHHIWEAIAYVANTIIFILSGVIIAKGIINSGDLYNGYTWGHLFLLYVFVQITRIIVVVLLYPFLRYFGYGLDRKEAVVISWSGLRGAVSLSMALSIKRASSDSLHLSPETGSLFLFFTGGTAFLTLIVNGSTTQFLLNILGMGKLSYTERCILDHTKQQITNKALEAHANAGNDEPGPVEWHTDERYPTCLNNLVLEGVHPYIVPVCDLNLEHMNLKATRMRFLKATQAAYLRMLDEGTVSQTTANVLLKSVDKAVDLTSDRPLCDWNSLQAHTNFLNYCEFLQTSILPQKLVRYITMERLHCAYYICSAFLQAHSIARKKLLEFMGNNEITSIVIDESEAEEIEARKFLEDVHVAFPQVLHAVKDREVAYSELNVMHSYVENLEKDGLLEEAVVLRLHELQTDTERLLQNPPSIELPQIRDMITLHPFLGTLPPVVCEAFEGSMKEMLKPRGVLLYKEGSVPKCLWIITNGLCEGNNLKDGYCLQASFPQGCALGLYEILIGKPCICDVTTDSVALCYSIEAKSLLAVLRSSPGVVDIFWLETVGFMAKLLLPGVFEKATMDELRALIAEKSVKITCAKEETIEILEHFVGFLLEGSLRTQDLPEEVIESPVALLPSYGNPNFLGPEISGLAASPFCHCGFFKYRVERKARIVCIDLSAWKLSSAVSGGS